MKRFIFVLLLTWPLFGTGQTITIVDTLITKSIHQDVVAINVSMSFPLSEEKRLCIHKIHKHIVTDPLVTDELERGENTQDVGLIFVLEDNSGHIIHMPTYPGYPGFLPILSQPTLIPEDDGKDCYERRVFVDEQNMATYSKLISCDSLVYYDDSQLVISHPDTTLTLYAILQAEKLEQGRYKIYLYYSVYHSGYEQYIVGMEMSDPVTYDMSTRKVLVRPGKDSLHNESPDRHSAFSLACIC